MEKFHFLFNFNSFFKEVEKYFKKLVPISTNEDELMEANTRVLINFIGYMITYVLNYRESMFKLEKFKDYIKSEDHIIVLTEYEKKIRKYVKVNMSIFVFLIL